MMKHGTFFRIACAVFMTICLTVTTVASAASEAVAGSKGASETSLTIDQRQTDITLSFPAAEYTSDRHYDIVFCMDASNSVESSNLSFSIYAEQMLEELASYEADVKVGVVKFKGRAFDTLELVGTPGGLVQYNEENAPQISAAINLDYQTVLTMAASGGTNLHGGLKLAESILASDTETTDDHKFLIVLTDGKTYIWNDENGEAVTNYTQWYRNHVIQGGGAAVLSQGAGCYDKPSYSADHYISSAFLTEHGLTLPDVFWFKTYEALYASTSPELTGPTKYDQSCPYAYYRLTPSGSVTSYPATNGSIFSVADYRNAYEFTPGFLWNGMIWYEANPFEYTKNDDGTVTFLGELNPDFYQWHPDPLMKALYKCGHLWTELGEKYHTAVITYDGWGSASGLEISKDFCSWIRKNSERGTDISNTEAVIDLYADIRSQITHQIDYVIDSGIVTDIIPEEFSLVFNNSCPFRVKVGTQELPVTKLAEVPGSTDGIWAFGEEDNGAYPYTVGYLSESRTLKWNINVPVKTDEPVSLTYTLAIDADAPNGDYDTNESAVLEYWRSASDTAEPGELYTFPVPVVNYYVPEYTVTFKPGEHGKINDGTEDISGTYRKNTVFPEIPSTAPDEDFSFLHWVDENGNVVTAFPKKVTANAVYTAVWQTDIPETGDNQLLLWLGLTMLSGVVLAGIVCRKKKSVV